MQGMGMSPQGFQKHQLGSADSDQRLPRLPHHRVPLGRASRDISRLLGALGSPCSFQLELALAELLLCARPWARHRTHRPLQFHQQPEQALGWAQPRWPTRAQGVQISCSRTHGHQAGELRHRVSAASPGTPEVEGPFAMSPGQTLWASCPAWLFRAFSSTPRDGGDCVKGSLQRLIRSCR